MRLMTYNILTGGLDGSGPSRLPLIVELIRKESPDVLVLNECNHFELDRHRTLHRIERELGMRGILALADTGFHVGLFVRDAEFVESYTASTLHHAMIDAQLVWRGHHLCVVGVHLCPFGGQNRVAEAELLTRVARRDEWVFVAGDMNSISPHDADQIQFDTWEPRRQARHLLPGTRDLDTRAMALLEQAGFVDLGLQAGIAEQPTALTPLRNDHESYRVRIDYVFGSPRAARALENVRVIDDELAQRASDHYPVVADLALE